MILLKDEILKTCWELNQRKIVNFEPCVNKFSFVSPYWNPFTAIRWLAAKAIPAQKVVVRQQLQDMLFMKQDLDIILCHMILSSKEPCTRMVVGHDPDEMEDEEDKGILPLDRLTVESSVDLLAWFKFRIIFK